MNEAYYNRVMSEKLVQLLAEGGKYHWLIDYVKAHDDLDFQTGSNMTASWFSIYKGTGRVLTINNNCRPYTIKGKEDKYGKDYKDALTEKELDEILKMWNNDTKKGRYYVDQKGTKKEGYYQTLISRRYSLNCKSEDDIIIFDKEFVIGYSDERKKEDWNKGPKEWADNMIREIKCKLGSRCAEKIKIPGCECDFVGINKNGDLVLLELKRYEDSTKVYLAPLQVGIYGELVTNLLKKYKGDIEKAIFNMLEQKKELKMLSPAWKMMPKQLSGNVRLAVVVGGNSSKEVKKRFKVVRDVINKGVTYYTCESDGTLKEVEL